MAKITITIEDKPNGKVEIHFTPKVSEMINIQKNGRDTSAHGYALGASILFKGIHLENEPETKLSDLIVDPKRIGRA